MGVRAVVNDGQIANMESAISKEQKSSSSNVDKDQFMSLLVAQMKYQDPLEPTSNTEYISQYATFSELEQMQNMSKTLELSRASDMVGKLVTISPTEENGLTSDIQGQVDAVTYSNNKAFITVNGRMFSANDVTEVMSDDYATAQKTVEAIAEEINKLPNLNEITVADATKVNNIYTVFNALSDSAKELLDPSYVTAINQYRNRIQELLATEEENQNNLKQQTEVEKAQETAADESEEAATTEAEKTAAAATE